MYRHVVSHFQNFLSGLEPSASAKSDAIAKAERAARSLFASYYGGRPFAADCFLVVGSHGKGLATKRRTDVDVLFQLPSEVYDRTERRSGNKQSGLLQEVREVLLGTFPRTAISADGQIIELPFETCKVEVVPAFRIISGPHAGQWLTPNSGGGGSWRFSNPTAEARWVTAVDAASGSKASHLVKMLKTWKQECDVPIKSICLEVAAMVFVNQWQYRTNTGLGYHDFMVRDFFEFFLRYVGGFAKPAGIEEWIPIGSDWEARCRRAYQHALSACALEMGDDAASASNEWGQIFGSQFQLEQRMDFLSAYSIPAVQLS